MESALKMEKDGNEALLAFHKLADQHNDYDVRNFLSCQELIVLGWMGTLGRHRD